MKQHWLERIKSLLKIGLITNTGDDTKNVPSQQASYHGKTGNGVAWYPYGYHAVATNDSYALVISVNGNNEERILIPTSMTERPSGEAGEVFVFHPGSGTKIKLDNSGNVEIDAIGEVSITAPDLIRMTAADVEIEGNLDVSGTLGVGLTTLLVGQVDVTGVLNANGLLNDQNGIELSAHTHTEQGDLADVSAPKDP